jgi:hypothetical protein
LTRRHRLSLSQLPESANRRCEISPLQRIIRVSLDASRLSGIARGLRKPPPPAYRGVPGAGEKSEARRGDKAGCV